MVVECEGSEALEGVMKDAAHRGYELHSWGMVAPVDGLEKEVVCVFCPFC